MRDTAQLLVNGIKGKLRYDYQYNIINVFFLFEMFYKRSRFALIKVRKIFFNVDDLKAYLINVPNSRTFIRVIDTQIVIICNQTSWSICCKNSSLYNCLLSAWVHVKTQVLNLSLYLVLSLTDVNENIIYVLTFTREPMSWHISLTSKNRFFPICCYNT